MFQSAPGLIRPGDDTGRRIRRDRPVSIRARPDQAGRHESPVVCLASIVFQSAPGLIRPGDPSSRSSVLPTVMFQSAPGLIRPGDRTPVPVTAGSIRFNPRPA